MGTLLLKREPALALLRMLMKYVLEPAERPSAVDRDLEQRTHPVVADRIDELRNVAITGLRALVPNDDVPLATFVDLLDQLVVIVTVQPQHQIGFAIEKPSAIAVAIFE